MKKLKFACLSLGVVLLMGVTSCKKAIEPENNSEPNGTFTATTTGTFTDQNDAGSAGTVSLGTDEEGFQFVEFGSDFTTNTATGTVTIYLSTSDTFTADPGNGNPDLFLVGGIKEGGAQYLKVDPTAASKYNHVILWCGSASVPFGYAPLN